MKKHYVPFACTAGFAMLAFSPAQENADPAQGGEPPAPAQVQPSGITEGNVAAYLQAEREMLDMISFDDAKEAEKRTADFMLKLAAFRKAYPKPLATYLPKDSAPAWLISALKEEHAMLMELIELGHGADKTTRINFPGMTFACKALYEPMLLSHVALKEYENRLLEAYAANQSLENAKAVMTDGLGFTDQDSLFYRIGFTTQIFTAHADKLQELLEAGFNYADNSMGAIVIGESLWLLHTDEAIAAAMSWPTLTNPAPDAQRPDFLHLENLCNYAEESHLLDCAWGMYDATHDIEILRSFIRCAVRPTPPENGYAFWGMAGKPRMEIPAEIGDIIALTARWSVHSRAKQNPVFAQQVQEILSTLTPEEVDRYNAPFPEYATGGEYHQN